MRRGSREEARRRGLAPWPWLVLALLLGGCPKAHITRFQTAPEVACPGDSIHLSWEANGPVRLQATPEVPGLEGPQERVGERTVTLQGPTRFRLEVSRLFAKKEFTEQEILSAREEREFGVVDSGENSPFTCREAERALEALLVLDERNLSPRIRVEAVTNMNARPLEVSRGEATETVPAGARAPRLAGQLAQGPWRLRLPLQAGESCDDALESVSGRLVLKLQLSCMR